MKRGIFKCVFLLLPILTSISTAGHASAGRPDADRCRQARLAPLDGVVEIYGPDVFAIELPAAGRLMVNAVPPAGGVDVNVARVDCGGHGTSSVLRALTLDGFVVDVHGPVTVYVDVWPQDFRRPLADHRLVVRFSEGLDARDLLRAKTGIEEPEPEPEPDGLTRLCPAPAVDDHDDVVFCASPLVEEVTGWIDRGEVDVFEFDLGQRQMVSLEAVSETDVVGALYDARGHRLKVDAAGDSGFLIVRTLAAGRYFLRVAGALGAPGAYTVRLSKLDGQSR